MIDPEKRLWTALRAALRKCWLWYSPARKKCHNDAKRPGGWLCAKCGGLFKASETAVDHVTPCGSLKSLADLPGFAARLFGGKLQLLCDCCHGAKTLAERRAKKAGKKGRKR